MSMTRKKLNRHITKEESVFIEKFVFLIYINIKEIKLSWFLVALFVFWWNHKNDNSGMTSQAGTRAPIKLKG